MIIILHIGHLNRCLAKWIVLHDCVISDQNVVHYVVNSVNKYFLGLHQFFQEVYISKANFYTCYRVHRFTDVQFK